MLYIIRGLSDIANSDVAVQMGIDSLVDSVIGSNNMLDHAACVSEVERELAKGLRVAVAFPLRSKETIEPFTKLTDKFEVIRVEPNTDSIVDKATLGYLTDRFEDYPGETIINAIKKLKRQVMGLKLITSVDQLPKGVVPVKLPVVYDMVTKEYYELGEGKSFTKDKTYVEPIPLVNLDRENRILKFMCVLTGIKNSVTRPQSKIHSFLLTEHSKTTTNNNYLTKDCVSSRCIYNLGSLWRRLTDMYYCGQKFGIAEFDVRDRTTVERTTSIGNTNRNLTGYVCVAFGIMGGLKGIVEVTKHEGDTIEFTVLGIGNRSSNVKGYLAPIHHVSKQKVWKTTE